MTTKGESRRKNPEAKAAAVDAPAAKGAGMATAKAGKDAPAAGGGAGQGLSFSLSASFSARPVAPGVAAASEAQVEVKDAAGSQSAAGAAAPEEEGEARRPGRPLTPEEREQMKRELKAQLRAYVDALKKEMLNRKEGEKPDLEEAMTRAEMEAARVIAERKRQQLASQRSEDVAVTRNETEDRAAEGAADARAAAASVSGGEAGEAADETARVAAPRRDVMDVASPAALDSSEQGKAAETAGAETAGEEGKGQDKGQDTEQDKGHVSAIPKEELDRLTRDIIAALKTVYDPEIPVDIYELGLVYRIDISDDRVITIDMTLTAPGCPVAGDMPGWVKKAVSEVEGVKDVKVNLVFDPPWDMSRMSDEARLALNMF